MFDVAVTLFVTGFLLMGVRRPFIWVLAYLYVDIVSPQKITYHFLAQAPLSMVTFCLAVLAWVLTDREGGIRISLRQGLILALLAYCGLTTIYAQFPLAADAKWVWVWKALVFAAFLPLTLRTRLRIEAAVLVMVLSIATIIVSGAIKTLLSGGGYGVLKLLVNDNTGLYEGSIISMAAVATVPLILWLAKHGSVYPPSRLVTLFAAGLVFACLLIPIGTVARTGLICEGVLALALLRNVKRRGVYLLGLAAMVAIALPLLPSSYTERMDTIENHQSDESASTRIAVWNWTLGYAAQHPFGGGFAAYLGNKLKIETTSTQASIDGSVQSVAVSDTTDAARAFHSSYFEMLGEQGWPGLMLWLALQITGLVQLEVVQRRLRRLPGAANRKDAALALALQQSHIIYLAGALFVGIAFQAFICMLIGIQIALVENFRRRLQQQPRAARREMVVPEPPTALNA